MSKSFEFLNVSGRPNARDTAYRKAVRQKSMRAYHRNDRLQLVHDHQNKKETTPDNTDNDSQSQLALGSSQQSASPRSPSSLPDPFASTSLPLKPHHHRLLAIFTDTIGEIILPKSVSPSTPSNSLPATKISRWATDWVQTALSSPLLLAATCNHVATFVDSVDMSVDRTSKGESIRLKQLTLGLLREEVARGGEVKEEVLLAVALLLADTLITRDAAEIGVHATAMKRMSETKNLQESSLGVLVDQGLGWHFAPISLLIKEEAARRRTPLLEMVPAPSTFSRPRISLADLPEMIGEFRRLYSRIRSYTDDTPADQDVFTFSSERSALEFRLVHFWQRLDTHGHLYPFPDRIIDRSAGLALLVQSLCQLRGFQFDAPSVQAGTEILITSLAGLEPWVLDGLPEPQLQKILWATVVASYLPVLTLHQLGVVKGMATKAARCLGLHSKDSLLACLQECMPASKAWIREEFWTLLR